MYIRIEPQIVAVHFEGLSKLGKVTIPRTNVKTKYSAICLNFGKISCFQTPCFLANVCGRSCECENCLNKWACRHLLKIGKLRLYFGEPLQSEMAGVCGPIIKFAKWTLSRFFQYFSSKPIPLCGITNISFYVFDQQKYENDPFITIDIKLLRVILGNFIFNCKTHTRLMDGT